MDIGKRHGSVELRDDNGAVTITGYAAVFYRADDPGTEFELWPGTVERIMPSAFAGYDSMDVRALFNHDSNRILGRTTNGSLRLSVDERGLRYEVQASESRTFQEVVGYVRDGLVDGSSFQFRVKKDGAEWRTDGDKDVRELRSVELLDVGPVTFPAYDSSTSEAASAEVRQSWQDFLGRQESRQAAQKEREGIYREITRRRVASRLGQC